MSFYTFHRPRVCLVDLVDLICGLYSWWEGFQSSCHAAQEFQLWFYYHTSRGSSTGVCSWGFPWGLRSASVRARCEGCAAAWVAGVLAAPGTQGSWRLGQQEIWCSRRVWQPVLADTLQYPCLENPPDREAWQATVYRVTESDMIEVSLSA